MRSISLPVALSVLLFRVAWGAGISSFSPSTGQPGTVLTVLGSGFTSATNFIFNPSSPTLGDFEVMSDSEMLVVIPAGAGSGQLEVQTSSSGSGTSGSSLTIAPQIFSFSPSLGANPTEVYIQGANFVSGNTTVKFSGASAVSATYVASTEVAVQVPTGAVNGPITVTTPAGSATTTSNFNASSSPLITSFNPVIGTNGTSVTIFGANFFTPLTLKFNGTTASPSVPSASEMIVNVPSGASSGPIQIQTSYGSFTTTSNFLTSSGPLVTSFSPPLGSPNTSVNLYGYNLTSVSSITVNGVKQTVTGYGSGSVQISITNGTTSGPFVVTTPQGSFTTPTNFLAGAGPIVTNFSPNIAAPGANVIINGINFVNGGTTVKFNGVTASSSVQSTTQVTATVPGSATTGAITVSTSAGNFTSTNNITVTAGGPIITGFSPTNGVIGTLVTINGANFSSISSVKFNGVSASYLPLTSTTVIYAYAPNPDLTGTISVTGTGGTGTSTATFYMQPWISNTTPSGIVNSQLLITGRNLSGATSLVVGGVNYTFSSSAGTISATVPSNALSGTIVVTTPGGIFITTNSFLVAPKIYSFSPTIGPAGTVVTIGGTSLYGVTNVLFNGVSATPYSITTNQLQVNVPTGATPGYITVESAGGTDVSTNSFTATSSSLLLFTKTVSPLIVGPGTNVTFTLTVTNEGPSTVTSVTVTDTIPTGFTYVSSTTSRGTIVFTNSSVIASLGILTNHFVDTVTVVGTSTNVGTITNNAYLGSLEGNVNTSGNYAYAFGYFVGAAQRTLTVGRQANELIVTWPNSGAPFSLQYNTNLDRGVGWQTIGAGIFVTNGFNEFTNNFTLPAEFFRLEGQ